MASSNRRKRANDVLKKLKKGIIPKNINKNYLLQEVKYSLNPNEIDLVLENADDETFNFLIGNPLPKTYTELSNYTEYHQSLDIERDLLWGERFLIDYNEEINDFLELEHQVENNFLLGRYKDALDVLDNIDKGVSKSLWSITRRLLIAETAGGFQENKTVLSSILDQGVSPLVASISSFTSIRIEKNISISQYDEMVKEYLKVFDESVHGYFQTKVHFFLPHNQKSAGMLLSMDGTLSIIDRYKAFIQAAQLILTTDLYSERVKTKTNRIVRGLSSLINDIDLSSLLVLADGKHNRSDTKQFVSMLDFYTSENYEKSLLLAKDIILQEARCFPAIYIYCRSLCYLDKPVDSDLGEQGSIIDSLIKSLVSILNKDQAYNGTISNIISIAQALGYHPLSVNLYNFLIEQLPNKVATNNINFYLLANLNSKFINPGLYIHVADDKKDLFLKSCLCGVGSSAIVSLIRRIFETKTTKDDFHNLSLRELKYVGLRSLATAKFEDALSVYNYILSQDRFSKDLEQSHIKVEITSGKFQCLVKLGQLVDALEFCVDTLIDVPMFEDHFFNPDFIEQINSSDNPGVNNNICLSIFLKFFEEEVDDYNIYVAYDNFLCSHNCKTPKDFLIYVDLKNKRHITFLDKVCKHDVLYSSPYLKDQDEMDLSRIEVCNFLGSKLSQYRNMETEVSDLLRRIVVRKGIKQIDYSKIYVDVKSIKDTVTKELRENFIRNVEIASLSLEQLNKLEGSVEKLFVYYLDQNIEMDSNNLEEFSKSEILKNVKLTSYDRFLHFKEAFIKIRDLFLFSPDNGLDTYLSMRIRHGTLPGQIRSVFEASKLITSWSDDDQQYLPNEYILSKYSISSQGNEQLNNAFNSFSRDIDALSEKLKTQIIQIQTESKPSKGMFNYCYNTEQLLKLFTEKLGSIKDFEIFVEGVISELWNRTEGNLQDIRRYLNTDTTKEINKVFEIIESEMNKIAELKSLPNAQVHHEIISKVRNCGTAIVVEIQKISEWFKRSNKKYLEYFDFSILLDSSVQALIRSFLGASIIIDNQCNLQIDGDYFPHFTDIVFYLLHNALKHSKLTPDNLQILIKVTSDESKIYIEVKNNVLSDETYITYCRQRIEDVKDILEDIPMVKKAFSREGGTGFPKIKKALTQNLSRKDLVISLNVDLQDSQAWFKAIISFEFDGILKQKTNADFNN